MTPRGRKARALLAYLISDPGTKIPKNLIIGLLWGDRGEAQARSSLRQVALELRRSLNGSHEVFFCDREHVWVAAEYVVEDAAVVQDGPRDAFQDLDNITPDFDEWLARERVSRKTARILSLKSQAEDLLARGQAGDCSALIGQIQALDPCNEDALRLGMQADFQLGCPAEIARRYEAVEALLREELGVEPSTKSRELRQELLFPLRTVVGRANNIQFAAIYQSVERALKMGAWEYNLVTRDLNWTPGTYDLFGVPVGSTIRRQDIMDQYEPSSRSLLESVRAEAIRKGTGFSVEVDIVTLTGIKRRLVIDAAVERSEKAALRIFGTMRLVA